MLSNRGGSRSGAGRPSKPSTERKQKISVTLDVDAVSWLENQGDRSIVLNRLVRELMLHEHSADDGQTSKIPARADA